MPITQRTLISQARQLHEEAAATPLWGSRNMNRLNAFHENLLSLQAVALPTPVATDSNREFRPLETQKAIINKLRMNYVGEWLQTASPFHSPSHAATTLIAEVEGWIELGSNWDGEGAHAPDPSSLRAVQQFVRLMDDAFVLPDAMLLPSGRAGLYWQIETQKADLEFFGDEKISYFVDRSPEGRHRGVVAFDQERIPAVLAAILKRAPVIRSRSFAYSHMQASQFY